MRYQGLDLNLLVALDALNVERNITRAGERIHLSQSGMSSALARLRDFFDDELFVLAGRELVPTALAESLVEPVRRVLIEMESSIINRPNFNPNKDNRCYRISASQVTMHLLVPKLIERLEKEAPNIRFELSGTTDFANRVERGEIDLALTPKQFAVADHPFEEIYQEGYKCICWKGNQHIDDEISLEQYQTLGHVAVGYGSSPSSAFDGWFLNNSSISRNVEISTSDLCAPPSLVVGTQRIATVHARLAKSYAESLPIRILEPPIAIPPLIQTIQYHRNRADDVALSWLRAAIVDVAKTI